MVSAPNSAPLHTSLTQTQSSIEQAQQNNDQSVKLAKTIHDKDDLINAYHKWKAAHP